MGRKEGGGEGRKEGRKAIEDERKEGPGRLRFERVGGSGGGGGGVGSCGSCGGGGGGVGSCGGGGGGGGDSGIDGYKEWYYEAKVRKIGCM